MSGQFNRFSIFADMADEGEVLVPATPTPNTPHIDQDVNPQVDVHALTSDLLRIMRENSHSTLAVLTALSMAANKVTDDTGQIFPSITPVIASQVTNDSRKKQITEILNSIWPPRRSQLPSPTWSHRSPNQSVIDSDSESDGNTPTRPPRMHHTRRRRSTSPKRPCALTPLAPGVTRTFTNNLPVNVNLPAIARKRAIVAANKAITQGLDQFTAENIGQGALERTIQDGIDSHGFFMRDASRPPTPGEIYNLFPPSVHSEDFKPTPVLLTHIPHDNQPSLSQSDPIDQFSSPPLGMSSLPHMESIEASLGTTYNTVPDSQPESLLTLHTSQQHHDIQAPESQTTLACAGGRQTPGISNPMGLPASLASTLEYIDPPSQTGIQQTIVTETHIEKQACPLITQEPVPGEQACDTGTQEPVSAPFYGETIHPQSQTPSLGTQLSDLCTSILAQVSILSQSCINNNPDDTFLNGYESFVKGLLNPLVQMSNSTPIILENFIAKFHLNIGWYDTWAVFSLKPHHKPPSIIFKTHLNTLGGALDRFISTIKEQRDAYVLLRNTPAPDRSPLWYTQTDELDTHSHLSNYTITHIVSRLLNISKETASNIFDQVYTYCEERGIARFTNFTPDISPNLAELQRKCDVMEQILHKFCEPFESLPPNDLNIATKDMIELLKDDSHLRAFHTDPTLFTTGIVNTKLRFMHTALVPYMELRRNEHMLNPDIWKMRSDGTLANPLNNHPLLNSNFPQQYLLPLASHNRVFAPAPPTGASPTKQVPSENLRSVNEIVDASLSVPKASSANPVQAEEEISTTTFKQGTASSMHAPGVARNATDKVTPPPTTPTKDYSHQKHISPEDALVILKTMVQSRESLIKKLEIQIGKNKDSSQGPSDDTLLAMQQIEDNKFDLGQLQDIIALDTHEKRVAAISILLSTEHHNKLREQSPADSELATITSHKPLPTPEPLASFTSTDADTFPLGHALSLNDLNSPLPPFVELSHNKFLIDQVRQLHRHCVTAYRRFHTATDCLTTMNGKTLRVQQKAIKPLHGKVNNINFSLSEVIYKRIQSLQNFISSSDFNELPPLNAPFLVHLQQTEELNGEADTEALKCLAAHRELLDFVPKLNATFVTIAAKTKELQLPSKLPSQSSIPSSQYSTDSNEFKTPAPPPKRPTTLPPTTIPQRKAMVEMKPVAVASADKKYMISINYGHAAPINGSAPKAMTVQADINAAISKRNILGNTCTRASWSTAYALYLDFSRPPGDLIHDAIHSTIYGYKRPGIKDPVIKVKDVSPTSIVNITNLQIRNPDRSIMGLSQIWNSLLEQNEYWTSLTPANTLHPLSVQRLFRPDQSTTSAILKFCDTPDKQVLNYLTTRKWIFNDNMITLTAYHLDQPQPMCHRCQMWGHRTTACNAQHPCCAFCAGLHSSDTHIQHSHCCQGHDPSNGYECLHQRKCRNCNGQHISSSTDCPYFEIRFDKDAIKQKYMDNRKNITVPLAPFQDVKPRHLMSSPTSTPPPPVVAVPKTRTITTNKKPKTLPAANAADSK